MHLRRYFYSEGCFVNAPKIFGKLGEKAGMIGAVTNTHSALSTGLGSYSRAVQKQTMPHANYSPKSAAKLKNLNRTLGKMMNALCFVPLTVNAIYLWNGTSEGL